MVKIWKLQKLKPIKTLKITMVPLWLVIRGKKQNQRKTIFRNAHNQEITSREKVPEIARLQMQAKCNPLQAKLCFKILPLVLVEVLLALTK